MDIKEALQAWSEWYSSIAEAYDVKFSRDWGPRYQELIRRANIAPGSKVLDIGTGSGRAAFEALKVVGPSGWVTGVDNAEGMLRIAREHAQRLGYENVEFKQMDLSNVTFPDDSFDHVISSLAIYGAFPPGVGVREASRVLKKDGKLTFTMLGKPGPGLDWSQMVYALYQRHFPKQPSELLRKLMEATRLGVVLGFYSYGPLSEPSDPSATLRFLREVGLRDVEANMTYHRQVYPTVDALLDSLVSWRLAYREMTEEDKRQFRDECHTALRPFASEEGFALEIEVICYSGYK